jgi:pimeloyl-ACP methyl ester carboxylesterase
MNATLVGGDAIDHGSVTLPDGRSIGWTSFGAPETLTVIGQPHVGDTGANVPQAQVISLVQEGIRLVQVSRAGLGRSTRRQGRTEQTDAEDTLRILDALGIDRASLVGECGGTGAILAVAARWPSRVRNIALVSPMAPSIGPDADGYVSDRLRMARRLFRFGPVARWIAKGQARAFNRDPERFMDKVSAGLPAVDRRFVDEPEWRSLAIASSAEFYASPEPYVDEWRTALGPWTVALSDVHCPVEIHHGELDTTTPVAMARWLSGMLPSAELHVDPDRGHFMAPDPFARILKTLATRA